MVKLLNFIHVTYFVEEQNEVDGKGNKKSQKSEVVEVPGQVVLRNKNLELGSVI